MGVSGLQTASGLQQLSIRPDTYLRQSISSLLAFMGQLYIGFYTLMFRLISCQPAWEAAGAVFITLWVIPLYRPFYAKLV